MNNLTTHWSTDQTLCQYVPHLSGPQKAWLEMGAWAPSPRPQWPCLHPGPVLTSGCVWNGGQKRKQLGKVQLIAQAKSVLAVKSTSSPWEMLLHSSVACYFFLCSPVTENIPPGQDVLLTGAALLTWAMRSTLQRWFPSQNSPWSLKKSQDKCLISSCTCGNTGVSGNMSEQSTTIKMKLKWTNTPSSHIDNEANTLTASSITHIPNMLPRRVREESSYSVFRRFISLVMSWNRGTAVLCLQLLVVCLVSYSLNVVYQAEHLPWQEKEHLGQRDLAPRPWKSFQTR